MSDMFALRETTAMLRREEEMENPQGAEDKEENITSSRFQEGKLEIKNWLNNWFEKVARRDVMAKNHESGKSTLWSLLLDGAFPISEAFDAKGVRNSHDIGSQTSGFEKRDLASRIPGRLKIALAIILILLIANIAGRWRYPEMDRTTMTTSESSAANSMNNNEQSILATIEAFTLAEQRAGEQLDVEVIKPYVALDSSLFAERQRMLAWRKSRRQPHRATLVARAIRELSAQETTAVVVALETWQNQESTMIAPLQATFERTYYLERDTEGSWRIASLASVVVRQGTMREAVEQDR